MASKHMKKCSISYIINELQIKTTMRYYYMPIRMTEIQFTDQMTSPISPNAVKDVELQKLSFVTVGIQNGTATLII